jgi:hypothetical protein
MLQHVGMTGKTLHNFGTATLMFLKSTKNTVFPATNTLFTVCIFYITRCKGDTSDRYWSGHWFSNFSNDFKIILY